jgi:VIT1/CCC1 family predicted Fe2+/Mn2+ transporter
MLWQTIAPSDTALYATIGKYLRDLIFGANDGVITTLAVVAGVVGASLSPAVVLILGFANLLADGFSMGASNGLSRRSDAQSHELPTFAAAATHGIATFLGFVVIGIIPLLAYLLPGFRPRFAVATVLGLATLFAVGAGRAPFTKRGWLVRAGDAADGYPRGRGGLRRRSPWQRRPVRASSP